MGLIKSRIIKIRSTSSDSFEFPHPSIKILAALSGTASRMMCAMSLYDLNQSNVVPSASLREYYLRVRGFQDEARVTCDSVHSYRGSEIKVL